ncbi:MAG TPA: glycosyltransferase, partial [Pyrinomonadaceae bacterium]|nr:glycosyltransferase [Pyrinomonadaceae bacterium]
PPRETVDATRGEAVESSTRAGARTLLAMGRLSYEKGFDLLLYAFGLAAGAQPGWHLEVWGEGPLRGELGRLAEGLGLAGRVSFPGFTRRPYEVMRRADLFAVTSRCEGFSNVLAEAMACGLPVVSFDCPSGPRHVIRDGVDGLLVAPQNVSALAATLGRLMSDERERARLASRAPEILERFGTQKVLEEWERLLAFEGTASRR